MAREISVSVSAHGYGAEEAFDHRAEMTKNIVIKTKNGQEFLEMLTSLSKNQGTIRMLKIFSHSYPRGIIMTNWSGFYDEPGPHDTKQAAYIKDMATRVENGEIVFSPNCEIRIFGCNIGGSFSQLLSMATHCTVIGSTGGTYPEIRGNRETGVFISTSEWAVYKNGNYTYSAGKRLKAW